MLEAVHTDLVFTISLKRSTPNLQLSTSSPADYPIYTPIATKFRIAAKCRDGSEAEVVEHVIRPLRAHAKKKLSPVTRGKLEAEQPAAGPSADSADQNFSGTKFRPRNDAWSSYLFFADLFGSLTVSRDIFLYGTSSRILEMQLRRPRLLSSDLTICQGA
jgi:hypothetical protein